MSLGLTCQNISLADNYEDTKDSEKILSKVQKTHRTLLGRGEEKASTPGHEEPAPLPAKDERLWFVSKGKPSWT